MTRAALYLRLSTKGQTTENQELELRRWTEGLGFQVAHVYRETVTGARANRVALTAAHQHQFDRAARRGSRYGRDASRWASRSSPTPPDGSSAPPAFARLSGRGYRHLSRLRRSRSREAPGGRAAELEAAEAEAPPPAELSG